MQIYIWRPSTAVGQQRCFWFDKLHILRSDKEVKRLDKKEARADGGRRFQRERPATKRDLDLAIVVLV